MILEQMPLSKLQGTHWVPYAPINCVYVNSNHLLYQIYYTHLNWCNDIEIITLYMNNTLLSSVKPSSSLSGYSICIWRLYYRSRSPEPSSNIDLRSLPSSTPLGTKVEGKEDEPEDVDTEQEKVDHHHLGQDVLVDDQHCHLAVITLLLTQDSRDQTWCTLATGQLAICQWCL